MSAAVNRLLDSITLKDLCLKARELAGLGTSEGNGSLISQRETSAETGYMYVI
jgi:hypothetical protein